MKTKTFTLITIPERGDVAASQDEIRINDYITDGYNVWQWKDSESLLGRKKVIASSFPIKGVVKIVDEAEREANKYYPYNTTGGFTFMCKEGVKFKEGFNHSKKLRPFTEEDMIYLLRNAIAEFAIHGHIDCMDNETDGDYIKRISATRERTILLPVDEQGNILGERWIWWNTNG